MSELNLLIECINTEGEAEEGGIKYIFMDADTIYRFENNRMKKISKTLINKARKQLATMNTISSNQTNVDTSNVTSNANSSVKTKRSRKQKIPPPIVESTDDESDNEYNEDEEPEPEPIKQKPKKGVKSTRSKHLVSSDYSPNINLDEYYNNKNKMEYMNLEITRLNNKVDKLKQYKAIVNKLTGNEFDFDIPQQQQQQQQQQQYANVNSNSNRNDSLFLY